MTTQFLADLNLHGETKKKDWAAYKKMEVTEDLLIVSRQILRSVLHFEILCTLIHCIFDYNMLTTFLASKCYDRRYNICWSLPETRGFAPVCIQHDFTMIDVGLP